MIKTAYAKFFSFFVNLSDAWNPVEWTSESNDRSNKEGENIADLSIRIKKKGEKVMYILFLKQGDILLIVILSFGRLKDQLTSSKVGIQSSN